MKPIITHFITKAVAQAIIENIDIKMAEELKYEASLYDHFSEGSKRMALRGFRFSARQAIIHSGLLAASTLRLNKSTPHLDAAFNELFPGAIPPSAPEVA